jgi:hypothetical protein
MKILGIVLIVLGIVGLAYGGITWSHRDKVVDLGPVNVTTTKHESIPLPPILGVACLVVGGVLLFSGNRRIA